MKIHHVGAATLCPRPQRAVGGTSMTVHCLIIETPRDGLVLVDTGLGRAAVDRPRDLGRAFLWAARPQLRHADTLLARVQLLGATAADVRHVVLTHLDLDHAGGLADFPDAMVHVHTREHAAAMARATGAERRRYLPPQWGHTVRWSLLQETGDTWMGLPAVRTLPGVAADIAMVPLHGHTRGHSGVVIAAPGRALLHAGDAYFHRAALTGERVPWDLLNHENAPAEPATQHPRRQTRRRGAQARRP